MTVFPVSSSHLSAEHLARFLQEQYGFSPAVGCRFIRAGINDTYRVTDAERCAIFRVYSLNWRTKTEIAEEIRLLERLREEAIPVSYALPDLDGCFIQWLQAPEGARPAVLFTCAAGEKQHSPSPELHAEIGAVMARMHRVTKDMPLERVRYTPQNLLIDPLHDIAQFLGADTEEMAFLVSAQTRLLRLLESADVAALREGVVHLDIWFDNLHIDTAGSITLFDFDFCGTGPLCLDAAYYLLQLHNTERDEQQCRRKVEAFLQGYQAVEALSDEEKRLLPALGVALYFFYLGVQCRRFDNWSNTFLSETYLKRYINGLVKRYYDLAGLG